MTSFKMNNCIFIPEWGIDDPSEGTENFNSTHLML